MNLIAILSNIRFPDVLDILFISVVSYQLYKWFWGTKAFKALIGIVVLSGIFMLANAWGLFLTTWVFQILWQVFVILLIILFQGEIRQMLERFNPLKSVGIKKRSSADDWLTGFAKWAFDAAKKKMGAIVVFERSDLIFDLVTKGITMESKPFPEIFSSIFEKKSPLHDGAVIVSNGKILKTSCYLPLTTREDLPQEWGTRHRASLGLTELCDAWVLIISEERGEVSVAMDQSIRKVTDEAHLIELMENDVLRYKPETMDIGQKVKSWFTKNYQVKAAVFSLVFVMWLAFAGQQDFEKAIELDIQYRNIPVGLEIDDPADRTVTIVCRGLRKDISMLSKNNMTGYIDVASSRPGTSFYTMTESNLLLPNDRVDVVNISPSRVILTLGKSSASPAASRQ